MYVLILISVLATSNIPCSSWTARRMDTKEDTTMKKGIECWAVSYPESVNCKWKLEPAPQLNTSFVTTYRLMMEPEEAATECIQSLPHSCTIWDFQMFSTTPYILNVTAINSLGSRTYLHLFIVEQIIKPDPPENLSISPMPGERKQLMLHGIPQRHGLFHRYFPLKYLIPYKKAGSKTFRKIELYEQTFFILKGIRPRTVYSVQVAAKDFTDYGEQSTWSPTVSGKAWAKL
ncbi:interleukin-27 subunit beta [Microcaecilia unicolor]|uniref:Interleukin-27 subunit beta n=1 Tax=Microcaecilia unicolor TaxID=1415580 RepID=A0A6P7ZDB0_9AMPH|nr:interleukin-27 subunit beta [Microcaecilia unicolor]